MDHKARKGAALSGPLMVLLVHSLAVHGQAQPGLCCTLDALALARFNLWLTLLA